MPFIKYHYTNVWFVHLRTYKAVPADVSAAAVECDLTFVGLIASIDPERREVPESIRVWGIITIYFQKHTLS